MGVAHAAVGRAGAPAVPRIDRLADGLAGPLAAVGGSVGRMAVAAPAGTGTVIVLQGRADHRLAARTTGVGGRPFAVTRSYLDDVALATVGPGPVISVRVEHHFERAFNRPRQIRIPAGRVTALTVTMDYRTDVVLAWQEHGAIYEDTLRENGHTSPIERVGPAAPDPQLRALISDDLRDHGMFAWSTAGPAGRTSVFQAFSSPGVRFGRPVLLASFADPRGAGRGPGSLALVRLSTENVLLAWTTAEHGHLVVRAAPAHYAATRPTIILSDPTGQSVLADLAPGPAGEALALWRSAAAPGDASRTELWSARVSLSAAGRLLHRARALVDAAGPHGAPSVAVDAATDRAFAAWLASGAIEYAVDPNPVPRGVASRSRGTVGPAVGLAVAGAAAMALAGIGVRRRRRRVA